MNPRITDLVEDNDILTFKMSEVNVSIANALRRTILSEINISDLTVNNRCLL